VTAAAHDRIRMDGRVALVTGAGSATDAGCFVADLTGDLAAAGLVAAVLERFDRVDALVNNAGMVQSGVDQPERLFADMSAVEWERHVALNLTTTANVTRAVVAHMLARGGGRIVNTSSVTGAACQSRVPDGLRRGQDGG